MPDYEDQDIAIAGWWTEEPPKKVLSVVDQDGDTWSREGDRWFVSFQPALVGFGHNGDTSADVLVYREWWEITEYGPFTEAV